MKTLVITGGNKGIGASIAQAFYAAGYHVVIGARQDNGFAAKLPFRAKFVRTDVRREKDHVNLAQEALSWAGQVDVYVNCAGFSRWRPLSAIDEKFWNEMLDTNLKGTLWGCKAAAKVLRKGGCIINISSLAGKRGGVNNSAYCASKFGVTGLTQALAKELGPKGIRVNAVCPVYVETAGLMKALKEKSSPAKGKNTAAYLKKFAQEQSALQRLPSGQDVANACLFLASDAAASVTGQSLNVD
ncbi:MAG: SDR family oxidoreductase, partial [Candidatus Omnitrophota bacterium]|nr:SDR family oxidoreductase [Candidatus Omnitrophota bacterium]